METYSVRSFHLKLTLELNERTCSSGLLLHNKLTKIEWLLWQTTLWVRNSENSIWKFVFHLWGVSWDDWGWQVHFQDGVFTHSSGSLVFRGVSLSTLHLWVVQMSFSHSSFREIKMFT